MLPLPPSPQLKHHNPYSGTMLINLIPSINSAPNNIGLIIIQIIMQLSIPRTKLLLFQKQTIIHQRQRIEDVEFEFLG
jgi:hypothetical protein